jgi:hypothetical protein
LRLLEAVIGNEGAEAAAVDAKPLWVQLPGGARMEVHDAQQALLAAELLRVLAARQC